MKTPINSSKASVFMDVVIERHSGREYDSQRPVPQELLNHLIEAAHWAPSCWGEEPWRFLLCRKDQDASKAYTKVLQSLVPKNQEWAQNAPILIVVSAHRKLHHNGQENRWAAYDTGAAAQVMMLAACSVGLMAHSMGGFDPEKLRKAFSITADFEIMAVMALGYEVASPKVTPHTRKPIEERFFFEEWKS